MDGPHLCKKTTDFRSHDSIGGILEVSNLGVAGWTVDDGVEKGVRETSWSSKSRRKLCFVA